ncbi:MAG: hypothetical protein HY788_04320 [Deltaproteobacteria bacterium]|nr:hypothetical protein [Deltaproteobacteria bacterium]
MDHVPWHFYVDSQGSVTHMSGVQFRRFLYEGGALFPDFADRHVRVVIVFMKLKQRLPSGIARVEFNKYPVDAEGALSKDYWPKMLKDTMEYIVAHHEREKRDAQANVIGYERFSGKGYERRYQWKPDDRTVEILLALIESRAELPPHSLSMPVQYRRETIP